MRSNHVSSVCRVMVKCNVAGCGRRHHTLMHREDAFNSGKLLDDVGRISACTSESNVQLGMVPVRLVGPRASVDTYAFLDNGSDTTVVRSDLCSQLGLEAIPKTLTVNTIHGTKTINSAEVNLTIQSLFSDTSLEVCRAYTVRELPIKIATTYNDPDTTQHPHLSDIKFGALADPTVGILVGCDVPEAHWILEQRIGRRGEPFAEQTMLGWTLRGPCGADATRAKAVNYIGVAEVSIDDCFRNMCEKEFQDPDNSENASLLVADCKAVSIVERPTKLTDSYDEIGLLLRHNENHLSDNLHVAARRLAQLRRRSLRDRMYKKRHANMMQPHAEKETMTDLNDALQDGGFKIEMWSSGRSEALKFVPDAERLEVKCDVSPNKTEVQNVLILKYDKRLDEFQVRTRTRKKQVTRKGVLACVPLLYDSKKPTVLQPSVSLLLRGNPDVTNDEMTFAERYRGWCQAQQCSNPCWKRWRKEYSPTVKLKQRWGVSRRVACFEEVDLLYDKETRSNREKQHKVNMPHIRRRRKPLKTAS
ncbi:unnamed protein product [Calicophoron daubneyi]|uniref:Peptidase aspartic putative domain-containing protein n=1 Tax=Calicophoron daubneyi TaxID=300641 RepID=A0AAV2TMJ1_CALDB